MEEMIMVAQICGVKTMWDGNRTYARSSAEPFQPESLFIGTTESIGSKWQPLMALKE